MPYFISNDNPDCRGWAVEKEDREVIGCHRTRRAAIAQMVAVSLAEGIEPGGERPRDEDQKALPRLVPPQTVRDEAEQGLRWRREYGRGGTAVGVARARDLANGRELSIETIRRMISFFARHAVDLEAPQNSNPQDDGYPGAGLIAWKLWGGTPGRAWAERMNAAYEREQEREDNARSEKEDNSGTTQGRAIMKIKHMQSTARYEVKAASETAPHGEVRAVVSVFGNEDLVGDRVLPGAFSKSLDEYKKNGKSIPWVWSHKWDDPQAYIGRVVDAKETEEGLEVKAEFFDTPTAQHVRSMLATGILSEFSFAYDIVKQAPGKDGVNELAELRVIECGPTLRGANNQTRLIGVRSATAVEKAEPGELEPGNFVEWADGYGRVEYVMTEGFFGVDGDPMSLEATADDPLALVREYEESEGGYEPTEIFTGHRFSELTKVEERTEAPAENPAQDDEEEVPAQVETASAVGTGEKAGRTLSAKNESRIKDAVNLLSDVLASLTGDENSKSEEPNGVKDEGREMDPETVSLILEIETELE